MSYNGTGTILAATILAVAVSYSATAAENKNSSYFEAGFAYSKFEVSDGWFTNAPGIIRFGSSFGSNLSLEATLGTSVYDTNFYAGTTLVSARIDSVYSLAAKYEFTPNDESSVYGKLGFGGGQISASTNYGSAWASDTDIQYGVGFRTNSGEKNYWSLDYTSYYNKSGVTLTGLGVTYGTRF